MEETKVKSSSKTRKEKSGKKAKKSATREKSKKRSQRKEKNREENKEPSPHRDVKKKLQFKQEMPREDEMQTLGSTQEESDYALFDVDLKQVPVTIFDEIKMQSKEIKMLSLNYMNDSNERRVFEVLSSIPNICEVRNYKLSIPSGGTDHIKLCLRAPKSEIIAEVKLLIRDFETKEVEEMLQFDINV
ncbi:unnamed protein product [Moneuplotes crassus]|uniref:Uncharacterized protein n=1 Tax=Euplotes crassus TaxID=5936 RepID=A0AAD1XXQ9_EUPCR|nr:unnamed protein product [Moneuplotes crassus]